MAALDQAMRKAPEELPPPAASGTRARLGIISAGSSASRRKKPQPPASGLQSARSRTTIGRGSRNLGPPAQEPRQQRRLSRPLP